MAIGEEQKKHGFGNLSIRFHDGERELCGLRNNGLLDTKPS